MPAPGLPPFLAPLSTDSHPQQVSRARLALDRARTSTTRLRFDKVVEAASISPHCTHCSTPTHPVDESVAHMLLTCPRHAAARTQLLAALAALCAPLAAAAAALPLTLATVLVTQRPPSPFHCRQLPALLQATSTFLSAVHLDRAQEQLLPLDTG